MDGWAKQIEAADNLISHLHCWCSISTRFILPHPISWSRFKLAGYLLLSACFNQCKQRLAWCSIWHLVPLWRHPSDLSLNPEKGQAMSQRRTQRGPSYRGVSQQLEAPRWERPTTRKRIGFVWKHPRIGCRRYHGSINQLFGVDNCLNTSFFFSLRDCKNDG